jgi:hypothetical protein
MKYFSFGRIDRNTVSVMWESGRIVRGSLRWEPEEAVNVTVRRLGKQWALEPVPGCALSEDDKKHILFLTKKYVRWATANGF